MNRLNDLLNQIRENIDNGVYEPLSGSDRMAVRNYYLRNLKFPMYETHRRLYTKKGTPFSNGFTRVVVGDYGAFIEISKDQIYAPILLCKHGQEYRLRPEFNGKYVWLTINDGSDIKIYYQIRTVSYADYKVGYFYVSPEEVLWK